MCWTGKCYHICFGNVPSTTTFIFMLFVTIFIIIFVIIIIIIIIINYVITNTITNKECFTAFVLQMLTCLVDTYVSFSEFDLWFNVILLSWHILWLLLLLLMLMIVSESLITPVMADNVTCFLLLLKLLMHNFILLLCAQRRSFWSNFSSCHYRIRCCIKGTIWYCIQWLYSGRHKLRW